jgi:hypothetical protein
VSEEAKAVLGALDDLKSTPVLLSIVLLNGFFIVSAAYYLINTEGYRAADRQTLIKALDNCVQHTVPTEFLNKK